MQIIIIPEDNKNTTITSRRMKTTTCQQYNSISNLLRQFLIFLGIHVGPSVSLLEECRFYFRYLTITGSFPLGNVFRLDKKKIKLSWTSFKVAYDCGVMVYVSVYGYIRVISKYHLLFLLYIFISIFIILL